MVGILRAHAQRASKTGMLTKIYSLSSVFKASTDKSRHWPDAGTGGKAARKVTGSYQPAGE